MQEQLIKGGSGHIFSCASALPKLVPSSAGLPLVKGETSAAGAGSPAWAPWWGSPRQAFPSCSPSSEIHQIKTLPR
ncbi:hypothetical protein llap_19192 [Limosa lapponica baueri]|uniref:Uncharacterized protein n=1 Tax=Limosa lapponica baueri TaxID=1758121 RepID=A0A2I0T9P1_LIMLA|nr:hypothetical protein llap_19192 [Limosa lapponica baueri]